MRKPKIKQIESHEVYAVLDSNGIILYIGSGRHNRHKHCESGCSHVYELNRMHFNGETFQTKILHTNLTKEYSIEVEKKLITLHQPPLNKQFMKNDNRKIVMGDGKRLKEKLLDIISQLDARNPILYKFKHQVEYFVDTYKLQWLISGIKVKYKVMEVLKGKDIESRRFIYFNTIFQYDSGILKLKDEIIEVLYAKEN